MVSTEVKLWFLSSLDYFWPDPYDTLSKVDLFFWENAQSLQKKGPGVQYPLNNVENWTIANIVHCTMRRLT